MTVHAYRRCTDGKKPFHVFTIDMKKGETEFSFFDDYVPADNARDMVEEATSKNGVGSIFFVITPTVRKPRARKSQ